MQAHLNNAQPDLQSDLGPVVEHHLQVVHEPHRELPVQVWMGAILVAQLPDRDALKDLNRRYVLQRLRHRVLMETQSGSAKTGPARQVD